VPVRLVALLQGSLFQSELLMSEAHFRRLFPTRRGYGFLLVESPPAEVKEVKRYLETELGAKNGLVVTPAAERLAAYQAVENTYLSTFQVLGGLGLLLGTAGLTVVLLRNVWERQGELALFRALGYSRPALGWLVLAENGFLVLCGLGVGVLSALVAVLPHLLERAGQLPWLGIALLIVLEILVGLLAGGIAVMAILRTPLLPALRRE
jgi:ABC-type antimicrobial peptide transport system permease subunit